MMNHFSFGVLEFFILSGGKLLNASVVDLIKGKRYEYSSTFTENAKEIFEYCCHSDPGSRPSFSEICINGANEIRTSRISSSHQNLSKTNSYQLSVKMFI